HRAVRATAAQRVGDHGAGATATRVGDGRRGAPDGGIDSAYSCRARTFAGDHAGERRSGGAVSRGDSRAAAVSGTPASRFFRRAGATRRVVRVRAAATNRTQNSAAVGD